MFSLFYHAQVAVEKTSLDGSSILDFNAGTTKGIILPALTTLPASPPNGFLGFNKLDARVYAYQNNIYVPLTQGTGIITALITNPSAEIGNGVIIGAATSTASGVLVLESTSLALTLPKINQPHLNVKSPYPGMMCYDTATNTIAIFDGAYWNYWK